MSQGFQLLVRANDKAFPATTASMKNIMDLQQLIQQLESVIKNPEAVSADDEARSQTLKLLRAASIVVETPLETLQRIA